MRWQGDGCNKAKSQSRTLRTRQWRRAIRSLSCDATASARQAREALTDRYANSILLVVCNEVEQFIHDMYVIYLRNQELLLSNCLLYHHHLFCRQLPNNAGKIIRIAGGAISQKCNKVGLGDTMSKKIPRADKPNAMYLHIQLRYRIIFEIFVVTIV